MLKHDTGHFALMTYLGHIALLTASWPHYWAVSLSWSSFKKFLYGHAAYIPWNERFLS